MRRASCLVAGLLLLSACDHDKLEKSFQPPERDDRIVRVEQRIAPLIEKAERGSNSPGQCTVRILGQEEDTTWVWATCRWLPSSGKGGPYRVQGKTVTGTKDGSEYDDSVRQLFPADMAQAILHDAERLQPEEYPLGQ